MLEMGLNATKRKGNLTLGFISHVTKRRSIVLGLHEFDRVVVIQVIRGKAVSSINHIKRSVKMPFVKTVKSSAYFVSRQLGLALYQDQADK
jgi:hypothetical protein